MLFGIHPAIIFAIATVSSVAIFFAIRLLLQDGHSFADVWRRYAEEARL
jgi:hypothetical protein